MAKPLAKPSPETAGPSSSSSSSSVPGTKGSPLPPPPFLASRFVVRTLYVPAPTTKVETDRRGKKKKRGGFFFPVATFFFPPLHSLTHFGTASGSGAKSVRRRNREGSRDKRNCPSQSKTDDPENLHFFFLPSDSVLTHTHTRLCQIRLPFEAKCITQVPAFFCQKFKNPFA